MSAQTEAEEASVDVEAITIIQTANRILNTSSPMATLPNR
jgi:hypothetical protein